MKKLMTMMGGGKMAKDVLDEAEIAIKGLDYDRDRYNILGDDMEVIDKATGRALGYIAYHTQEFPCTKSHQELLDRLIKTNQRGDRFKLEYATFKKHLTKEIADRVDFIENDPRLTDYFDKKGDLIYWEGKDGDWVKYGYDEDSKLIYQEESCGYIHPKKSLEGIDNN